MQIKNPSNRAIENVRIFGVLYSIDAEGTLSNVPEAHARYWQENLHKFLVLRKDKEEVVPEVVEVPTPEVKEVVEDEPVVETESEELPVEEVKEEESLVVEEKPKSKGRPKKVK